MRSKGSSRKINGLFDRQIHDTSGTHRHWLGVGYPLNTYLRGVVIDNAYGVCITAVFEVINMIRGTTPTHTFKLPFDSFMIKDVRVIYAQNDVEVFHKDIYECELDGNELRVTLTQSDTLKLNHRCTVQIQVRVLTTDDVAMASNISTISVGQCLNDEVI
jgi:hypothetical protein